MITMTNYIESVKTILYNFLSTYFTVALGYPALISIVQRLYTTPLAVPHIRIQPLPGSTTVTIGGGKLISDDGTTQVRGEWKQLVFAIIITTDHNTGREKTRDKYSSYLERIFLQHYEDLGTDLVNNTSDLTKVHLSPATPLHIEDKLIENYHELTCQILLEG